MAGQREVKHTGEHVVNEGQNVLNGVILAQAFQQIHEELGVSLSVLDKTKTRRIRRLKEEKGK